MKKKASIQTIEIPEKCDGNHEFHEVKNLDMAEKREIEKKVKKWQKRVDKREEEHEQLQYLNMKRKRDK